jgi:hypothetical protein
MTELKTTDLQSEVWRDGFYESRREANRKMPMWIQLKNRKRRFTDGFKRLSLLGRYLLLTILSRLLSIRLVTSSTKS